MFYQIFHSPQVKGIVIISNKHGSIYELPHELPNDLRLNMNPTAFSPLGGLICPDKKKKKKKRLNILGKKVSRPHRMIA